jgi:hypothetical protein
MVHLDGAVINQFFDVLEDWEKILKGCFDRESDVHKLDI